PRPARSPHQEERNWRGDEPSADKNELPSEAIRQSSCDVIRQRLGDAEDDDEGENRGLRREVELLFRDRRQEGALQSDHRTDEGVDDDEERELPQVLTDTKTHGDH